MNPIDSVRVLKEMQALATQATHRPPAVSHVVGDGQAAGPADFASILGSAIHQVNAQQVAATDLATAFDMGTPGVDLTQVMIESQKAAISFKAMSEVRNKLVSAYQDIMNMPI